jgi:hypothetical protein
MITWTPADSNAFQLLGFILAQPLLTVLEQIRHLPRFFQSDTGRLALSDRGDAALDRTSVTTSPPSARQSSVTRDPA